MAVGLAVGALVGLAVGLAVGFLVGFAVGLAVGCSLGDAMYGVCSWVGTLVVYSVGGRVVYVYSSCMQSSSRKRTTTQGPGRPARGSPPGPGTNATPSNKQAQISNKEWTLEGVTREDCGAQVRTVKIERARSGPECCCGPLGSPMSSTYGGILGTFLFVCFFDTVPCQL